MAKYKDISNEIRLRIKKGVYKNSNNQIPDEMSLCKEFNCSRMTVKKALELLVLEGLIYRRRGHGSFVIEKSNTNSKINILTNNFGGLTKDSKENIETKILDFKLIFASKTIAEKLDLAENSPIYEILRLRIIKDTPVVLEKTFFNPLIITGLTTDIIKSSIYEYIESTLKLKINSANRIIRADKSTASDKKYLNISDTEPVLEIEQLTYLNDGRPFSYSFSRHKYDKFEFTTFAVKH
ncbi:GntR family transcriptional regulator [Clostridium oceanicum]|uniref:GntR family transcriptional regulator n=1 Tax=Clostridium oceanicum TaxID=1543 RepID=A0ABN1JIS7_9CLOT